MDDLLTELLAEESRVWGALAEGDAAADAAVLCETFLGVYPSGFSDRAGHVAQLAGGPTVAEFHLSDARAMAFGPDHGLLAYRADYRRPDGDATETMLVSSVWRKDANGWINVFSQDTPLTGVPVP